MASALGASFQLNNMSSKFCHPVTGKNIHIFLDACHMLKLLKNTLASKGSFFDLNQCIIKWQYIENMHKVQYTEGLLAATKVRKSHIEW